MTKCSIPDCPASVQARVFCGAHYQRWRRHGDATETATQRRSRPALTPSAIHLSDLLPQDRPRIGLVCPRCAGQVVRTHPDDDASCLWCGFAPLEGAVMAAGAAAFGLRAWPT